MTTSSEDVLLLVNNVRHKKSDGTLYVMGERIAWIMNGKNTFSISHKYSDVKMQKISPDGRMKVQLQISLLDGGASTFHFTNPVGMEAQIQDRDSVKELLVQLLPRFKRKINKELEEKNRILAEDPELFQLYRDLVTSEVITPEEFWASHTPKLHKSTASSSQDVGVSGAFLADIKPQTDGCNGLKYNITADIIESIFKTYPAVKKKHLEYVPDKLSEGEFWTRFFQSHYFHRDRLDTGTKDLFVECIKSDEQDIRSELTQVVMDPLLDINSFQDSSLDEGYGESSKTTSASNTNAVNQNMIRRFNHHSMMVLKVCDLVGGGGKENAAASAAETTTDKSKSLPGATAPLNGFTNHVPTTDVTDSSPSCSDPASKKAKIQSKLVYDDLEADADVPMPSLNLSNSVRYLHGPTPVMSADYATNEDLMQALQTLNHQVRHWNPNLSKVLPSTAAFTVLGELSPGGALMHGVHVDNLQQLVPQHVQQELKNLYSALCELMRHFWSCFPVTTDFLQEKLVRMHANLERFQYAKIKPFQDSLLRDHYNTNLVDHLNAMIDSANTKFATWQMRRRK